MVYTLERMATRTSTRALLPGLQGFGLQGFDLQGFDLLGFDLLGLRSAGEG